MERAVIFLLGLLFATGAIAQDTINRTDPTGKKTGYWIKKDQDGKKVYEGTFRDNHPVGTMKYYYPSGPLKAVSVFSPDGNKTHTITYFTNGRKMSEGNYVNEKRDSLWRFFSEYDDALLAEENYKNGVKDGISKTYYANDGVAEIITWKNGIKDGLWEQYYEEGKIKLRGYYRNNEKDGILKTYFSSGKILYEGKYDNGNAVGTWMFYDERGDVTKKEFYERGLMFDKWELRPDTSQEHNK